MEFNNPASWLLRDTRYFTGIPLPEYSPALEFKSNILAILVANSEALETWNFAGWASQKIILGIGPGPQGMAVISNRKLWLRQTQILIFPQLDITYRLGVRFPRWFDRASCTIWEYISP